MNLAHMLEFLYQNRNFAIVLIVSFSKFERFEDWILNGFYPTGMVQNLASIAVGSVANFYLSHVRAGTFLCFGKGLVGSPSPVWASLISQVARILLKLCHFSSAQRRYWWVYLTPKIWFYRLLYYNRWEAAKSMSGIVFGAFFVTSLT